MINYRCRRFDQDDGERKSIIKAKRIREVNKPSRADLTIMDSRGIVWNIKSRRRESGIGSEWQSRDDVDERRR